MIPFFFFILSVYTVISGTGEHSGLGDKSYNSYVPKETQLIQVTKG